MSKRKATGDDYSVRKRGRTFGAPFGDHHSPVVSESDNRAWANIPASISFGFSPVLAIDIEPIEPEITKQNLDLNTIQYVDTRPVEAKSIPRTICDATTVNTQVVEVSTPQELLVTNTKREFFDLPREIRDVIYELSVSIINAHTQCRSRHGSPTLGWLQCNQPRIQVHSGRSPYFALDIWDCLVRDRWFYVVSLVSKQFGLEARQTFLQRSLLSITRHEHDGFIYALGPEAMELRHLQVSATTNTPEGVNPRYYNYGASLRHFSTADAEKELRYLRARIHPKINIYLTMGFHNTRDGVYYFHCIPAADHDRAFVAQKVYPRD